MFAGRRRRRQRAEGRSGRVPRRRGRRRRRPRLPRRRRSRRRSDPDKCHAIDLGSNNVKLGSARIRMYISGKMSPADAILRGFAETCARPRADLGRRLMPREGICQGKPLGIFRIWKSDPRTTNSGFIITRRRQDGLRISAATSPADPKFTLLRRRSFSAS